MSTIEDYCNTLPEKVNVFMDENNPNRKGAFHAESPFKSSDYSLDCAAYSMAIWLTSHHNITKSTLLVNIMLRSGVRIGRIQTQCIKGEECDMLFNVLEKLISSYPKIYNTY